jgi:hypothetical protein
MTSSRTGVHADAVLALLEERAIVPALKSVEQLLQHGREFGFGGLCRHARLEPRGDGPAERPVGGRA